MTTIPVGGRIGDYVIESALDAPPWELAYAATHVLLPRRARIVIAADQNTAMQVVRHAILVETLHHPAAPRVFECGRLRDRRPWVATELVEGRSIADLDLPMSARDAIVLLRDLAGVLEHSHARKVTHGMLQPDVVIQGPHGVRIASWTAASQSGDPSGDIRALATVVVFAMTRAPAAIPVARRCPDAPARLTALLDRMLSTQPAGRPTAADVRAEASVLAEQGLHLLPEDDGIPIEVDDVVLVDISHDPTPPPTPRAKLRWTPATGGYLPPVRDEMASRKKAP